MQYCAPAILAMAWLITARSMQLAAAKEREKESERRERVWEKAREGKQSQKNLQRKYHTHDLHLQRRYWTDRTRHPFVRWPLMRILTTMLLLQHTRWRCCSSCWTTVTGCQLLCLFHDLSMKICRKTLHGGQNYQLLLNWEATKYQHNFFARNAKLCACNTCDCLMNISLSMLLADAVVRSIVEARNKKPWKRLVRARQAVYGCRYR